MVWVIGGLVVVFNTAVMWALVAGSDRRKWDDEYQKAENEGQAERIEEMRRSKIKKNEGGYSS